MLPFSVFAQSGKGMFSAQQWQEVLIRGNIVQGIMVFGNLSNEKVNFNHEFFPAKDKKISNGLATNILCQTKAIVKEYEVIDYSKDGIYPSDHFPVIVKLVLK